MSEHIHRAENRSNAVGISVVLATRNRAEVLRQTLDAFCSLEDPGVPWELLVVDNGSSDHTRVVVESFGGRLPIRYLYEGTPGKVNALNSGVLQTIYDLVLMTDDDIIPCEEWMRAYAQAAAAHPEASYFGGPIDLGLSSCDIPRWTLNEQGQLHPWLSRQLGHLDLARVSPEDWSFYGGNVAYRKALFERFSFDTRTGYSPKRRLAAEETLLQIQLRQAGEKAWYVPGALIWHRIRQDELTFSSRLRRILWASRGKALMLYILGQDTRVNLRRTLRHVRYAVRKLPGLFAQDKFQRIQTACELARVWGYEVQMARLLWQ